MKLIMKLLPTSKSRLIALAVLVVLGFWGVRRLIGGFQPVNQVSFSDDSIALNAGSSTGQERYTALSLASMRPGADVYTSLIVTNTGTSAIHYDITAVASGDAGLSGAAQIQVAAVDGGCGAPAFAAGSLLFNGNAGLGSVSVTGEPLASGETERLCFRVRLPGSASAVLSGKRAQATVDFTAASG